MLSESSRGACAPPGGVPPPVSPQSTASASMIRALARAPRGLPGSSPACVSRKGKGRRSRVSPRRVHHAGCMESPFGRIW